LAARRRRRAYNLAPPSSPHRSPSSPILSPHVVLAGTTITTALKCPRQAWLQERFSGGGGSGQAAQVGTMLHELLQRALVARLHAFASGERQPGPSRQALLAEARAIAAAAGDRLFEAGMDEAGAMEAMGRHVDALAAWLAKYVAPSRRQLPGGGPPDVHAPGQAGRGAAAAAGAVIARVVDIEENIWAPRYGLKGQLDATLAVQLSGGSLPPAAASGGAAFGAPPPGGPLALVDADGAPLALAPFEFKSGREHVSHRAQVALYLLLMRDRYAAPVSAGLLWNARDAGMSVVHYRHSEVAPIMARRNGVVAALAGARGPAAPPPLREEWSCARCPVNTHCALLHRVDGGGAGAGAGSGAGGAGAGAEGWGMPELYQRLTGHVAPAHAAFGAHWLALVDAEEGGSRSRRPEIWALPGPAREAAGGCAADLRLGGRVEGLADVLAPSQAAAAAAAAADSPFRHLYAFVPGPRTTPLGRGGLAALGFAPGDMALLSLEGSHVAVARVYVRAARPDALVVACKRELAVARLCGPAPGAAAAARWRLDRDEAGSIFGLLRTNVLTAAADPCPMAARWRRRLIDREPPGFRRLPPPAAAGGCPAEAYLAAHAGEMNAEQAAAVRRVLGMQDYALIQGLPGSGKTTAVVHAVRALLAAGASVLVTSYTNSAVDNILLKLAAAGVDFLRLGRSTGVHPALAAHTLGGARYADRSAGALAALAASARLVGVTALSVHAPLLAGRAFDVVVIDEAGQAPLPALLGPLMRAHAAVLVGDPYQLPPLVTSAAAAAGGYGASLFRCLAEAHPHAVSTLARQYRMCSGIMGLANELIYGGRLLAGSPAVAARALELPAWAAVAPRLAPWLRAALDPARPVVFIDTDAAPGAAEARSREAVTNPGEAAVVAALVAGLMAAGLPAAGIGLCSPYRSQVAALEGGAPAGVEVLTVDRYQARARGGLGRRARAGFRESWVAAAAAAAGTC